MQSNDENRDSRKREVMKRLRKWKIFQRLTGLRHVSFFKLL